LVFADTLDDFVLDVGDVHDVFHVVAGEFERAADEVGEDERAPVADVRVVINGRAAAIQPDFFAGGIQRRELLDGARERVEQFQGHLSGGQVTVRRGKEKWNLRARFLVSRLAISGFNGKFCKTKNDFNN